MVARLIVAVLSVCTTVADPKVHDPRLRLELFARDPDIVTPIGLAIDSRDRVFVIESHTHMPPRDYPGPKFDRIKVFGDANSDGKAGSIGIFAEGLRDAMNLAFGADQSLYVVCGKAVERLRDENGDGAADSRSRILELKTSNNYSHSALLGITVGPDGWVYVSRGNNGSAAYTLVGSDGSSVEGFGDGGDIVRCRLDGSKVERFATGFWNPFDIKFDADGRALCVDNDPDARGPNRLLHIVQHGDYGYRSIYGGAGNHPFQGWVGDDRPGTLPMIDGTGEAPSGLLDGRFTSLPKDAANSLLVTIWGENTITRHVPRERGVSLSATNHVMISGGQDFRPVALAADSKGAIYITDWVLVEYPNHGRGRLWKLVGPGKPKTVQREAEAIRSENPVSDASSADPFLRHAAVVELSKRSLRESALQLGENQDARARLSALLALRRGEPANPETHVRKFLQDSNSEVRRAAMIWAAEESLTSLLPKMHATIERGDLTAIEFRTYLAAVELLQPQFVRAFGNRASDKANQLPRQLPRGFVEAIVARKSLPAAVRAIAISQIDPSGQVELLGSVLAETNSLLQTEALRSLGRAGRAEAADALKKFAQTKTAPASVRAEALGALSWHGEVDSQWLIPFLDEPLPAALEAARLLRSAKINEAGSAKLQARLERETNPLIKEALQAALEGEKLSRPASIDSWIEMVSSGGDLDRGARVFFSARTGCTLCHTIGNRGGELGPELSGLSSSVSREQIVRSIIRPSESFPPQYQAWFIRTKDGEATYGLQLDHASKGLELLTTTGKFEFFATENIESYGPAPRSLMPDGLEQTMTVSEMRDLVSFLQSNR